MSHADICPCLHDTYVCLVPCRQCFPLAQLPDLDPEIRARHHELAVKVEQLRDRPTVTDEEVEAAARAWVVHDYPDDDPDEWEHQWGKADLRALRAALEAAARVGVDKDR